jgi:predicted nucleic acid-binding protein
VIVEDRVAVNGIVQVELIGFAAGTRERALLEADFEAFHWLELTRPIFDLAARLGFDLRRRGRTVPATDLIIAAFTIWTQAELLHMDDHFDEIERASDLVARNPTAAG